MADQAQPFAFNLHGMPDGKCYTFFYGIERSQVIEILEGIIQDYKKIEKELKEMSTPQYKGDSNGIEANKGRDRVSNPSNTGNSIQRKPRPNRANRNSLKEHPNKVLR